MTARTSLVTSLLLSALLGCQGSASVKISFDNRAGGQAGQALTLAGAGRTPTVFGIRLVAAYLAEDQDEDMNNVGEVGRIWTNPVCDPDGYHCSITPTAGQYQVKDYFDLALPSEQVNARLNSQPHDIKPGTYRLLRVDMAGPMHPQEQTTPNMRFGMESAAPVEIRRNNNYVVKLDPPLELADGDSVTMSLGYDVRDSYYEGDSLNSGTPPEGYTVNDWYCNGDESRGVGRSPCLAFHGFFPSVTRTAK